MKSRRIRWAGHVARIGGEEKRIQVFIVGKPEERDHLENPN
jgi:hypothetical protein